MSTRAQDRLREVEARMRSLHDEVGDEPMTDEQRTEWDALVTERGATADTAAGVEGSGLLEQIRQEEARRNLVRSLATGPSPSTEDGDGARAGQPRSPEFMRQVEVWTGDDPSSISRREARDRGLKALEMKELTGHIERDDSIDKVDRLLRTDNQNCSGVWVARMLLLTEFEHYRSAFAKLVTQPHAVLTAEEARAVNAVNEYRAMAGATDSAGGFGVPVLIDPTIILTAQGSLNPFRRISRVETITTDAWRGVSSAGVSWTRSGEGVAAGDNSPTLAGPVVNVHEAKGWIPFSIRVGQDYPGFASEMSKLLMEGYDERQARDHAIGEGDGSDTPFGILTALDANTNVEVVTTTDGAFGGADVNKVWGQLPDRFKANAHWVMNTDVSDEIASFGNGNNLSWYTVDLTGTLEKIKNRPVEISSYFPDFTGTTGASNILVTGDFRNYLIADRAGMTVELVPHVMDVTNNRPTGQRGWFAYARDGADSINDNGFRLLQNQ